jgi:hypothetical protein
MKAWCDSSKACHDPPLKKENNKRRGQGLVRYIKDLFFFFFDMSTQKEKMEFELVISAS